MPPPPHKLRSSTMLCRNPLSLPDRLDGKLQAALAFWQSLKRAENGMPFGDDLALSALSGLGGRCFVLRAFAAVGKRPDRPAARCARRLREVIFPSSSRRRRALPSLDGARSAGLRW